METKLRFKFMDTIDEWTARIAAGSLPGFKLVNTMKEVMSRVVQAARQEAERDGKAGHSLHGLQEGPAAAEPGQEGSGGAAGE